MLARDEIHIDYPFFSFLEQVENNTRVKSEDACIQTCLCCSSFSPHCAISHPHIEAADSKRANSHRTDLVACHGTSVSLSALVILLSTSSLQQQQQQQQRACTCSRSLTIIASSLTIMSLLRALQRQGMLSDLAPPLPPNDGAVRLMTQTPTDSSSSSLHPSSAAGLPSSSSSDAFFSSSSTAPPTTTLPAHRRDNLTVGTRVIIAQDADLRGEISVGSGTVIHPKATILALQGPISIGSNCIIEETAVIVNRKSIPIRIGDNNLFQVGCRIEAASVGSYNVFEVRSRVAQNVKVGSYSVVGAGCMVLPKPIDDAQLAEIFNDDEDETISGAEAVDAEGKGGKREEEEVFEELPDQTIIYGADSKRRLWSGEGAQQQAALHAKHLEYLRDSIPRTHKLKIIQGVRAANSAPAS